MADEFGYTGKILKVNLSSGTISHVPTMNYASRFLGGRGIAAKIYWDEVPPEAKAYDPENCLIFMTGPLVGVSPGVGASRWLVCGKSPAATPEQFSYCNLGGTWGTELKFAGYDGLIIRGKSDKPVYIYINNSTAEIRDASHLWLKGSIETQQNLKQELGNKTCVAATGPAGDNLVNMAIICADHDACGTGGFGAVMGSKKLKAVTVRGTGKVAVADPERLKELNRYTRQLMKASPREAMFPGFVAPKKKMLDICRGCSLGCQGRTVYEAENGTKSKFTCTPSFIYPIRARRYYEGKDEDWSEVPFFVAHLINQYGLDANAFEGVIIWLTRCYREGLLTDEEIDIPISKIGSSEFAETLLKKMSFREGFGELLADGVIKAAERIGKGTDKVITDYISKSGQNSVYNPRFYITSALLYAMEPRQPIQQLHALTNPLIKWLAWVNKVDHAYVSHEVFKSIAKRFWGEELGADFSTYDGKAKVATMIQNRQYVKESLILCDWIFPIYSVEFSENHIGDPTLESKILSAVIGREVSEQELNKIGERIVNLQRATFIREARGSDTIADFHFTTPQRYVLWNPASLAPGKDGEVIVKKNAVLDRDKFEQMKREFYQLRGWDPETGLQTRAKLSELELGDIAEDLTKRDLAV